MNALINTNDPTTANLLSVINNTGTGTNTIIATTSPTTGAATGASSGNVQYYFALPTNGLQNGTATTLPLQLSGLQNIQGLPVQGIQTIQGLQGLQGAQFLIAGSNGQVFSVANRDC
jgi:hypothetical protein